MGLRYRLKQFCRSVTAGPLPTGDFDEVAAALEEAQAVLFQRFSYSDQRHSFRVYSTLKENGQLDSDLLTAALLHDIGKTLVPLSPWDRALSVIGVTLWPERAEKWGGGAAKGWRRPFVVLCHHAEWGAELAEQAGASAAAVMLIRFHQADALPAADERLQSLWQLLKAADDRS